MDRFCWALALILAMGWRVSRAEDRDLLLEAIRDADNDFHVACEQWVADVAEGKDPKVTEARLCGAHWRFLGSASAYARTFAKEQRGRFEPNNAQMLPYKIASAGSLRRDDARTFSYVAGTGQAGFIISAWQRDAVTETLLPPHGIALCVGIVPEALREQFVVGRGSSKGDDLIVPYSFDRAKGQLVIRRTSDGWEFQPDRGAMKGSWWMPFPSEGTRNK